MQRKVSFFLGLYILVSLKTMAQPEIKGAICVLPGTEYDYFVTGLKDSISAIYFCVEGGIISGTKLTCTTVKPESLIRVIWNENAIVAGLSISYSTGKKLLEIKITDQLHPGKMVDTLRKQILQFNLIPAMILCSPASGGSCSPLYVYQWQESSNALKWIDISGAVGLNLVPLKAFKETIFFRRKVTELHSGTIMYSDVYSTYVNVEIKSALPL